MTLLVLLGDRYCVTCHYSELQTRTADDTHSVNAGTPRCKKHHRPCVLRVVRKNGENKGRQFYACPLPREAQCGFFQVCVKFPVLTVPQVNFVYCNVINISACSFTYTFIYLFTCLLIYLFIYLRQEPPKF